MITEKEIKDLMEETFEILGKRNPTMWEYWRVVEKRNTK